MLIDVEDLSITTDIWAEMMTTESFLGVTIHFIYSSKLYSATLGIFELSESHSANYIYKKLMDALSLGEIPKSKILAVVTGNNYAIVKVIEENFGENKHLLCFAHSVNLVAEGSLKKVDGLEDLICQVKYISLSL